ncbi:MAG: ribonuclease P protein component [Candidatus Falkowbacteria bacterium]|nr:ribonuclease P protein component [Candidatus Falkowbacteria bacterium]
MLVKSQRLTKDKDFENIFKNGKSVYSSFFRVNAIENNLTNNRYGIIVSNKISKIATERNKIKRQIRYLIQKNKNKLKIGFDIVVLVSAPAVTIDYKKKSIELYYLFNKLQLVIQ